jgi:hypothetical protein
MENSKNNYIGFMYYLWQSQRILTEDFSLIFKLKLKETIIHSLKFEFEVTHTQHTHFFYINSTASITNIQIETGITCIASALLCNSNR